MFGICGIFDLSGGRRLKNEEAAAIKKMIANSSCPNASSMGIYLSPDNNCALCHAGSRFLTVPEKTAAHPASNDIKQPAVNDAKTAWLSFDGEIYNYSQIWKELEAKGHKFKTASDIEAVLRLYDSFGPDAAAHINGAFSAAIYDQNSQKLLLFRDRTGIKPLFTAIHNNFLYFASSIKSILAIRPELKVLNEEAVYEYLIYGYISAPLTIYQKIRKFMPAHITVYSPDGDKYEQTYWRASYAPEYGRSAHAFAGELFSTLKNAVKDCMNTESDTGVYLSGGINSSIIAALMSKISSIRIKSFNIGFDEDGHSDIKFAAKIADMFDTVHHAFNIKSREIELLPEIISCCDEPLADTSLLPAYQSARIVSKHAKIILTGDGADELFGGHEKYLWEIIAGIYTKIPGIFRKYFIEKIIKLFPASTNNVFENFVRKLKKFTEYCSYDPNYRHLSFCSFFSGESLRALIPDFEKNKTFITASEKKYETEFIEGNFENWVSSILYSDLKYYLLNGTVVKNECISAANLVETRNPFIDHRVIDLAMKIPVNYKIKNISLKNILKEMMRDILPLYILHRPKTSFVPPVDKWFRSDLRELLCRALIGSDSFVKKNFNGAYIKNMIEINHSGIQNFTPQLYNLFIFELWHKLYMGRSSAARPLSFKDIF